MTSPSPPSNTRCYSGLVAEELMNIAAEMEVLEARYVQFKRAVYDSSTDFIFRHLIWETRKHANKLSRRLGTLDWHISRMNELQGKAEPVLVKKVEAK